MRRRIALVRPGELSAGERGRWRELQQGAPYLDSPYFALEFVEAVAAERRGVEVAVIEDDGRIAGFFPFERVARRSAGPVGGRLSDFQGVIASAGTPLDVPGLMRACGLSTWRFDHLVTAQMDFRPWHWIQAWSPYVDLSRGVEAWQAARRAQGSRGIEQILYKERKDARRAGRLRFELHSRDDRAFDALLRWKGQQLRESGQTDVLALESVVALLERLRHAEAEGVTGVLSTLHLGDRLAAVHLGMRSRTTLHWWLPAYDPALAAHSPGQLCFLELVRAAAAVGVRRVDLGKGDEAYKYRLMSGAVTVAEGAVELRPALVPLARGMRRAMEWARRSWLRRPLVRPVRWMRRALDASRLE